MAQSVSHVMLDHMSSTGVMHGDGRRRGEEMVKHERKKQDIAAVHARYRNSWCMHDVVAFLLQMLVRVLTEWERKKGASVQSDGTTGKRRARVSLSGVSASGLAFPLFFPRSCGCCIAHT